MSNLKADTSSISALQQNERKVNTISNYVIYEMEKVPCIKNQLWFPKRSSCRVTHTENSRVSFDTVLSVILVLRFISVVTWNLFLVTLNTQQLPYFPLDVTSWAIINSLKTCYDIQWYMPIPIPDPHNTQHPHRKLMLISTSLAHMTLRQAKKHKIFFLQYSIIKVQFQPLLIYFTKKYR